MHVHNLPRHIVGHKPYEHALDLAVEAWNRRVEKYHGYEQAVIDAWDNIRNHQERTCTLSENDDCSSCGATIQSVTHTIFEMGDWLACEAKYCPECGAHIERVK